jgi:hypothetical protein
MSLFPLPTSPQSVKANALSVGPDTSRSLYTVSNPSGPTGGNNYLISSGNIPIQMELQPVYGGTPSASLVLSSTALTSSVPILAPASLGKLIYSTGVLETPQITAALNMATAGPGGTPLPAGQYLLTALTNLSVLPGEVKLQNGTVCVPIFWDGSTLAYGSFTPALAAGSTEIFANAFKVFTSGPLGQNTVGSYVTVDITDVYLVYPIPGILWQWQLNTFG